jgi:hypothetical protein
VLAALLVRRLIQVLHRRCRARRRSSSTGVLERADDVVRTPQFLNVIGTEFVELSRTTGSCGLFARPTG